MSKKIYISPSNQQANVYATGNTNEKEQCHKIAKACYNFLKAQGFDVMCTYNNNCEARVKESNKFGYGNVIERINDNKNTFFIKTLHFA